jgi:fructoselysine-6-P-deglycase FrlB-like protein
LTAVANDWDFKEIFSRQVHAHARPGDVVVGISTSGKSANVVRALEVARELGAVTLAFTGRNREESRRRRTLLQGARHFHSTGARAAAAGLARRLRVVEAALVAGRELSKTGS